MTSQSRSALGDVAHTTTTAV
ncbi:MAG: hypothetical protein QOE00_2733, partial [Ilumatobacteraceae bacterium]